MKMTIEDYIQKQRDITYLKLTREAQEVKRKHFWENYFKIELEFFSQTILKFLSSEDYDGKKQKEISVLESTLEYQAKVKLVIMWFF